jgi:SNF2 family DNA or RNA helicase
VDLNPHQIEAALFAFRSPLSRRALLADEVGLGKTIEAGLVLSQKWAERKRRILIITPSNLRKQWHQELQEKFFLSCRILETRFYNESVKQGNLWPFEEADRLGAARKAIVFTESRRTQEYLLRILSAGTLCRARRRPITLPFFSGIFRLGLRLPPFHGCKRCWGNS